MKNELKTIQRVLVPDYMEPFERQKKDENVFGVNEQQRSREPFLKIALHFLRTMKQEELADKLQSSKSISLKILSAGKIRNFLIVQENNSLV